MGECKCVDDELYEKSSKVVDKELGKVNRDIRKISKLAKIN